MTCDHCLRGDAEDTDISKKTVDTVLNQVDSIGTLTITGGEPMMNSMMLVYLLDRVMSAGIPVTNLYMVTNGTIFDKAVFFKIIEFYHYCDEPEMTSICVSYDDFHSCTDETTVKWWETLTFYGNDKDRRGTPDQTLGLILEGRAGDYGIGRRALEISDDMEVDESGFNEVVYVNALGEVVNDCDMSYQTQEDCSFGNVSELSRIHSEQLDRED